MREFEVGERIGWLEYLPAIAKAGRYRGRPASTERREAEVVEILRRPDADGGHVYAYRVQIPHTGGLSDLPFFREVYLSQDIYDPQEATS